MNSDPFPTSDVETIVFKTEVFTGLYKLSNILRETRIVFMWS